MVNLFLKLVIEIPVGAVEERPQDQRCAQYLRIIYLFMLESGFLAGGHAPFLKDCSEEINAIRNRPILHN